MYLLTEVVQNLLYVNYDIGKVTYSEMGYAAAQADFLGVYRVRKWDCFCRVTTAAGLAG